MKLRALPTIFFLVVSWLDGLAIGEPVGGEFFNWELFASTAAARAREERSLSWARIALMVYGVIAERAPADEQHSLMLSAMNLRGWSIVELGPREEDVASDLHEQEEGLECVSPDL